MKPADERSGCYIRDLSEQTPKRYICAILSPGVPSHFLMADEVVFQDNSTVLFDTDRNRIAEFGREARVSVWDRNLVEVYPVKEWERIQSEDAITLYKLRKPLAEVEALAMQGSQGVQPMGAGAAPTPTTPGFYL